MVIVSLVPIIGYQNHFKEVDIQSYTVDGVDPTSVDMVNIPFIAVV